MIRRNVIGIASAVALLAAQACGDSDSPIDRDDDSGLVDGGDEQDGGDLLDGSAGDPDASSTEDGGMDGSALDGGALDADLEADAAPDGSTPDAMLDAELPDASTPDASEPDATTPDGSAPDASTPDASLPALAAHYTFDETSGTAAADSTSTFGNATLVNGASWTTGIKGNAVDLAGGANGTTSNYVSLPADLLEGCTDVTVALWMRLGAVTYWTRILEIDGLTDGFLLFTPTQWVNNVPHLQFNIWQSGDHGVSAAYPAGTTLVDTWHHVAFTLTGGTGRLYFDGQLIGSNAMAKKPSDLTLAPGARASLGRSTTHPDPFLDATLDDLRVSCTAYSAEQIAELAK